MRMRAFALALGAAALAACAAPLPQHSESETSASIRQARELMRACKYDDARRALEPQLRTAVGADRKRVLLTAGSIAEHSGDIAAAITLYRQAMQDEEVPAQGLRALGMAQVRAKQYDDGRRTLTRYLDALQSLARQADLNVQLALAVALAEAGELDGADTRLDALTKGSTNADPLIAVLKEKILQARARGVVPGEFWTLAYGDERALTEKSLDFALTPVYRAPVLYPTIASRNGIEGSVLMSVSVDETGHVTDVKVVKSEPLGAFHGVFNAAAVWSIRKWRFEPKSKNCVNAPGNGYQQVDFRLSG